MISIRRGPCPDRLKGTKGKGEDYKNPDVVKALVKMQHGKCCYCEQSIPEKGHGRGVEHFCPQGPTKYKHLRNKWTNLLLACDACNGRKREKSPIDSLGNALIIDPSSPDLDPEDHITFGVDPFDLNLLGRALAKENSSLGLSTIDKTGIGERHFNKTRMKYILNVVLETYRNLALAKDSNDEECLEGRRDTFNRLLSAKSEFSGLVRAFARAARIDEKFGIIIPSSAD